MAREVNSTLGKILSAERGLTEEQGHELVKRLRSSNLYQVCSLDRPQLWPSRTDPPRFYRRTSGHRYLLAVFLCRFLSHFIQGGALIG